MLVVIPLSFPSPCSNAEAFSAWFSQMKQAYETLYDDDKRREVSSIAFLRSSARLFWRRGRSCCRATFFSAFYDFYRENSQCLLSTWLTFLTVFLVLSSTTLDLPLLLSNPLSPALDLSPIARTPALEILPLTNLPSLDLKERPSAPLLDIAATPTRLLLTDQTLPTSTTRA